MKKFLVTTLGVLCAMAVVVQAQDKPKHKLTDEQKALRKEMTEKYDANKDGKLDKDELSKVSKEDKDKLEKAGVTLGRHKKDAAETDKPATK
ncbi:MAG: hypothetical protein JWR69_2752 [Pedosphaera sp.]|nr:hypothetical protein [Pedosphaera sp.]